ncbi:SnoaL-like domain-containing protein [Chitinophagaceae bacterium MMS25-I14]
MNTQEVAQKLADYCRKGDFENAQKELYADNVISIEPMETPAFAKETKGKENVQKKIGKFMDMVDELYGNEISEPLITGNAIAFTSTLDIKMKGQERSKMSELCVYEVKDGKVVSEQFFM